MLAIFLTIVVPGLGHLFYGFKRKGFLLIALSIVGAFFPPLLILVYPYALYDIWKISATKPKPVFSRSDAWLVVAIGLIVPVAVGLLWIIVVPPLLSSYRDDVAFPRAVAEEGRELMDALDGHFRSQGKYPEKLESVVRGNPVRKRWLTDPWGRPYHYDTAESGKSYILMSSGADGTLNTADDIIIRNH